MLQIGVEHAGLVGRELRHLAEEHAVVAAQVAVQQRAFGGHVDLDRPALRGIALRRQGRGQIIGRAAVRLGRRPPVDAQDPDRRPHLHGQEAMVVDLQGVASCGADST